MVKHFIICKRTYSYLGGESERERKRKSTINSHAQCARAKEGVEGWTNQIDGQQEKNERSKRLVAFSIDSKGSNLKVLVLEKRQALSNQCSEQSVGGKDNFSFFSFGI